MWISVVDAMLAILRPGGLKQHCTRGPFRETVVRPTRFLPETTWEPLAHLATGRLLHFKPPRQQRI